MYFYLLYFVHVPHILHVFAALNLKRSKLIVLQIELKQIAGDSSRTFEASTSPEATTDRSDVRRGRQGGQVDLQRVERTAQG